MFYRQSIALFGFILPLLLATVVVGAAAYGVQQMKSEFTRKESQYKVYDRNRTEALSIEAQIGRKEDYVKEWDAQLAQETRSMLSENLLILKKTLPEKEFTTTQTSDNTAKIGGFGAVTAQKSTHLQLGFRGTFRMVQRALLELETRMPQLQLTEMKVDPRSDPNSPHPALLNVDVTYTAWTK